MPSRSIADTYYSIPELMRVARGTYKRAVDTQLAANGFEDLPTSSGFLLGYVGNGEEAVAELIEGLGISKREFSNLVDALILRGYITREGDPTGDRMSFALTERGRAALEVTAEALRQVDDELEHRLSKAELAGLRRGLAVLGEIKQALPGPVLRRGLEPR